ncbi:hypothetical protein AB8B21_18260 [Tardiphaga sp. 866_E4_N2_1]|uniref:hypothetical protein n=1 Tax=unclassified Tardiphaga TaxID=2631404 RepID=UPI003F295226
MHKEERRTKSEMEDFESHRHANSSTYCHLMLLTKLLTPTIRHAKALDHDI